ncbi:hypothetical protein [Streptomyces olivaceus]|uniref:hypothetical protein n=1 Tax=Streptomyces olivaceus TaxID=47716 RepID=UPI001CCFAEF7|nr:hypothetical protein [Streptomyces olivaceus]MBZ6211955.1 hypothetical protein [Streptomyces olivaceus]MBZ6295793.1 hypothetical protein [Streptomyces olivaceus]MBZ6330703.1 hypothetical protein [Streptomyces olivaceus]
MKKLIAAAGIAAGGVTLVLTMQGSAQAAAPQVEAPTVASQETEARPQALSSLLGKAAVHVKAACPSVANAAGEVASNLTSSVAPESNLEGVSALDTVFDK